MTDSNSLGRWEPAVQDELAALRVQNITQRIWSRDHTVWKPNPDEIADRLGWLDAPRDMASETASLASFADQIKRDGYRRVVLLGMGGSSLGPEMLRQIFGSAPEYPELIVLDSTVPQWVRAVADSIDPARALFIVSSKSGSTIEPNDLYAYFRGLADDALGREAANRSFVAITDPGVPLAELASRDGFRRVFENPPDIGGRYSVLSYFGLVPAALMGIDLVALLGRANGMRDACAGAAPLPPMDEVQAEGAPRDDPGARLGAAIGRLALEGRDKLTIVASPSMAGFGLWAEQLIAESLGKEGRGVIPVAGEPILDPNAYGDDRLFVHVRLESDDAPAMDAAVEKLAQSGQPVVRLHMRDRYDVAAEIFRWEFAIAVAGAVIGVQPFDQPDVQAAKEMTNSVLAEFEQSGSLPDAPATPSFSDLASLIGPGDYVAVMAYLRQSPDLDRALENLRRAVMRRFGAATTMGYGPRFLHSTGQLHKGGPPSGVFLQLVGDDRADADVPGKPYTFGALAGAQALGDLLALKTAGRRVARLDVGSDPAAVLTALAAAL